MAMTAVRSLGTEGGLKFPAWLGGKHLTPGPSTPGCSYVPSLQGPSPWAALLLRFMGIVPRMRQMIQTLSDCCLPGWSVCTDVVASLM